MARMMLHGSMWLPRPVRSQIVSCQQPECLGIFLRHMLLLPLSWHSLYQGVYRMPPFAILVTCLQEEQVFQAPCSAVPGLSPG